MADNNIKVYHGTVQKFAKKILQDKAFRFSIKKNEWLGTGIYFYPDEHNAVWWSREQAKHYSDVPAIISANLQFDDNQFLDLDDFYQLKNFSEWCQQYFATLNDVIDFNMNDKHLLWCYCTNAYKRRHENVALIGYTFDQYEDIYTLFCFRQKQLCATDNSIVSNICKEA